MGDQQQHFKDNETFTVPDSVRKALRDAVMAERLRQQIDPREGEEGWQEAIDGLNNVVASCSVEVGEAILQAALAKEGLV